MELKDCLLVPSNDHIVEQLSKHYSELSPYYKMAVPTPDKLEQIVDKWHLTKLASTIGIPTPKTCLPDNIEQASQFRYPLLIKGRRGLSFYKSFHRKAITSNNYNELQTLVSDSLLHECIIQELVTNSDNRVVSFTCFSIDGDIKSHWVGVKLREHPPRLGTATLAQSIPDPGLLAYGQALTKALCYTGICEIEFMWDETDKQYKLIEINPRTWLWVELAKACGIDYAKMLYNHLQSEPQSYPATYHTGLKWINTFTDLPYALHSILNRQLTIREYLKSLDGKKNHAIWNFHDPLPTIMLPLLSPTILKHRR